MDGSRGIEFFPKRSKGLLLFVVPFALQPFHISKAHVGFGILLNCAICMAECFLQFRVAYPEVLIRVVADSRITCWAMARPSCPQRSYFSKIVSSAGDLKQ